MAHRNPNLVPAQTVDRRGRLTTVYRSLAQHLQRQRPAARATPQPTLRSASELPAIRLRTRKEMDSLGASAGRAMGDDIRPFLRTPEGRRAGSLALDLIEQGRITPDHAHQLLWMSKHDGPASPLASLRVIAYLQDHMGLAEMPKALYWGIKTLTINGASNTTPTITTPGELAASAAVVEFALQVLDEPCGASLLALGSLSPDREYTDGQQLDALIRRRPEDVHRIAHFMTDRSRSGQCPRASDVETWLDAGGAAALDDGHL